MTEDKKDPLYGVTTEQDPLYGEGSDANEDASDAEAAKRVSEGKEHAEESGGKAQRSSGGGGQEGI